MACRPTSGTTYHVLTFALTPRVDPEPGRARAAGEAVVCLEIRYAARISRGALQSLQPSPDGWRRIAQDISHGLPSSTMAPDTTTAALLAAGEPVDVRFNGTWRIEATDAAALIEQIERRLAT